MSNRRLQAVIESVAASDGAGVRCTANPASVVVVASSNVWFGGMNPGVNGA